MTGKIGTFSLITIMTTTMSIAQPAGRWEQERPGRKVTSDYGNNIFSVSPLTVMEYGAGFGLSYEKIWGADKNLGVVLPFTLILEGDEGLGYPHSAESDQNASFYFTPGLKIYPLGQRRLTYAVGPSFMIGYGISHNSSWYTGYPVQGSKMTWLRMGGMLTNYLNFQLTRSFSLGLEMGLGVRYLDRQTYTEPGFSEPVKVNNKVKPTGRFAVSLGFRF